jgi:hypothetical protein
MPPLEKKSRLPPMQSSMQEPQRKKLHYYPQHLLPSARRLLSITSRHPSASSSLPYQQFEFKVTYGSKAYCRNTSSRSL